MQTYEGRSISYGMTRDGVMVQVQLRPPLDDEWDQMIESIASEPAEIIGLVIVVTPGTGGPSALQRKKVASLGYLRRDRFHGTAILTDSAVIRGMLTAVSWMIPAQIRSRAFSLNDLERAMDFLQLDESQKSGVRELLASLDRKSAPSPVVMHLPS